MKIILTDAEKYLWEAALQRWGENHQSTMATEECAETIKAITHRDRGRGTVAAVAAEFGDMFVCVGQLIHNDTEETDTANFLRIAIQNAFAKLDAKLEEDDKNHGANR